MSVESSVERDVFLTVLDVPEGAERRARLETACSDNVSLRQKIEQLLAAHSSLGDFLERPQAALALEETMKPGDGPSTPVGEAILLPSPEHGESLVFPEPNLNSGFVGRIGSHDVTRVIGRGGMGIVLHAIDSKLDRQVAIKLMAPEIASEPTAVRRFLREARLAAAVRHDHLVTIHAVEEWNGRPYLVMEYIAGGTLKDLLNSQTKIDFAEVVRIAGELSRGLSAAHRQGLVHRDIKPGNILMEQDTGRVKITDFGLARVIGEAGISHSGEVAGTPQFMAPEQAHGLPVDHRADLFSLGSLLYALTSGQPPFQADSVLATMRQVCDATPRRLAEAAPEIPVWFDHLVHKLLEKNPNDRFQSAEDVETFLNEHSADRPSETARNCSLTAGRTAASGNRNLSIRWSARLMIGVILVGTVLSGLLAFAGQIIRVVRGEGTIEFHVLDPEVEVTITGDNFEFHRRGESSVTVKPGEYLTKRSKPGMPPMQERVTVQRYGREIVELIIRPHSTADNALVTPVSSLGNWSEPTRVSVRVSRVEIVGRPALSSDGLTMIFESNRLDLQGRPDLWMSHRNSLDASFGLAVSAGEEINTPAAESDPCLSADGLTLVYSSSQHRPGGRGRTDLWMARRSSAGLPFQNATNLGPGVNSAESESCAALSSDGLTLIFASKRSDGFGDEDLWISTRETPGEEFGRAVNFGPAVNSTFRDSSPHLSADGLQLWFTSNRPGSHGERDLWFCTRDSLTASFRTPVNAGAVLNSNHDEESPTLSADGRTLLFESNRPDPAKDDGKEEIWTSRRLN